MEIMSLQEYLEAHKEEPKASLYFLNQRQCSLCRNTCHINNLIFLMGRKIDAYGLMSMNLCRNCLPHWKKVFIKHRLVSTPDQWHWSCWNLDSSLPHTEVDRISLHLKDGQFFLQTNFNPSKRQRDMTIEKEIR